MTAPPGGRRLAAAGLFACLAGLLAAFAALSHGAHAPVWRFVAIAIAAHAPYAALLAIAVRGPAPPALLVVVAAAALRLALVFGDPVLSDDVYRYVWDGRLVAAGQDPYAYPPSAPELVGYRDAQFDRINHPELRTIYPPLAELAFAAVASLHPSVSAFQAAAALAGLGLVLLVMAIAKRARRGDARAAVVAGIAYGLNPLACVETAGSGHLEPLAVVPVAGAIAILMRAEAPRIAAFAWRVAAGAAFAVGCCLKLVPLLLALPLGRRLRAAALLAPVAVVGLYALFWSPDLGALRTLDAFARRWEGNAGGFALIKAASDEAIGAVADARRPDDLVHLRFLDGPARALQGGFFSLHKDGGFDPSRPGAFARSDLALAIAKIVAAALVAAVVLRTFRRRASPDLAALWVFGALALLVPVLHPWYLLWVLPWAACRRVWPWLVFGAALPLAYLPLDGWWDRGVWPAPVWIPIAEYGALAIAAAAYHFLGRRMETQLTDKGDRSRNSH